MNRGVRVVRETRATYGPRPPSPPAYFLSLSIEGLRCFGPPQVLSLRDAEGRPARWTVILGDNGTGKSTLLQSLALMQPVLSDGAPVPLWAPRADSGALMGWLRGDSRAFALGAEIRHGAPLREAGGGVVTPWGVQFSGESGSPGSVATMGVEEHVADLGGLVCYGYGASRRMSMAAMAESAGDDATTSLFSEEVPLINAEEWLLWADYAALTDSPLRAQAARRRDQVRELLVALLPDARDIRVVRPEGPRLQSRVEVETPYGWVRIHSLSLGYRSLVAWIVDLAYRLFERYPTSPNPLAEPAIVLVDEIDLHLHPRWQRSITGYLTEHFPNTQFIATAHSPLIVQAAQDANVVLLRREGDHVVIDNDVESIRGWRIDQVLTSDLFGLKTARPPEFDDLILERNRILGKAELSAADRRRLAELDARIGSLPAGETPEEMEAMEIIREAASVLRGRGGRER